MEIVPVAERTEAHLLKAGLSGPVGLSPTMICDGRRTPIGIEGNLYVTRTTPLLSVATSSGVAGALL